MDWLWWEMLGFRVIFGIGMCRARLSRWRVTISLGCPPPPPSEEAVIMLHALLAQTLLFRLPPGSPGPNGGCLLSRRL